MIKFGLNRVELILGNLKSKQMVKIKLNILLVAFLFSGSMSSQNISEFLDSYEGENSIPYLQPIADLFTANLHGLTKDWSFIDSSIHIGISFVVMNTYPAKSQRTFTGKTDDGFEPEQTAIAPTIIGDIQPVTVEGINGTAYVFPGGYNLEALPMAAPQLTVSGIFNSELTARFFAFDLDDDLGNVSLLGIGVRHGLNKYFSTLPFDLTLGYFYHKFENDDHINSNLHLASAYLGKSGKWWSAQLMLGYQTSQTAIRYDFTQNEELKHAKVDLTNENHFIAELSASLKLSIFHLQAGLGYSGPVTFSGAIGFRF
jgi:hypothetical protein